MNILDQGVMIAMLIAYIAGMITAIVLLAPGHSRL